MSLSFFEIQFSRRIPSSWLRFLWFMACLAIACFALMAGQGRRREWLSQTSFTDALQHMLVFILPHCLIPRSMRVLGYTRGS